MKQSKNLVLHSAKAWENDIRNQETAGSNRNTLTMPIITFILYPPWVKLYICRSKIISHQKSTNVTWVGLIHVRWWGWGFYHQITGEVIFYFESDGILFLRIYIYFKIGYYIQGLCRPLLKNGVCFLIIQSIWDSTILGKFSINLDSRIVDTEKISKADIWNMLWPENVSLQIKNGFSLYELIQSSPNMSQEIFVSRCCH